MKEIEKHLEFEKNLVTELSDLGIHTESQFKVPGTDLFLDLYMICLKQSHRLAFY